MTVVSFGTQVNVAFIAFTSPQVQARRHTGQDDLRSGRTLALCTPA